MYIYNHYFRLNYNITHRSETINGGLKGMAEGGLTLRKEDSGPT